jgi:hypothetical protein
MLPGGISHEVMVMKPVTLARIGVVNNAREAVYGRRHAVKQLSA